MIDNSACDLCSESFKQGKPNVLLQNRCCQCVQKSMAESVTRILWNEAANIFTCTFGSKYRAGKCRIATIFDVGAERKT